MLKIGMMRIAVLVLAVAMLALAGCGDARSADEMFRSYTAKQAPDEYIAVYTSSTGSGMTIARKGELMKITGSESTVYIQEDGAYDCKTEYIFSCRKIEGMAGDAISREMSDTYDDLAMKEGLTVTFLDKKGLAVASDCFKLEYPFTPGGKLVENSVCFDKKTGIITYSAMGKLATEIKSLSLTVADGDVRMGK